MTVYIRKASIEQKLFQALLSTAAPCHLSVPRPKPGYVGMPGTTSQGLDERAQSNEAAMNLDICCGSSDHFFLIMRVPLLTKTSRPKSKFFLNTS